MPARVARDGPLPPLLVASRGETSCETLHGTSYLSTCVPTISEGQRADGASWEYLEDLVASPQGGVHDAIHRLPFAAAGDGEHHLGLSASGEPRQQQVAIPNGDWGRGSVHP